MRTTSRATCKATGRDVDIDEDRLTYDPLTRLLSMTGQGSRRLIAATKHLDELVPAVVAAAERSPGITGRKLADELRQDGCAFQRGDEIKAARLAVERGLLVIEPGPRNAKCYFVPTYPDLPDHPVGGRADVPRRPLSGTGDVSR